MGARVSVVFEGLDTVLNNLTKIEEKAPENIVKQTKALADDTEQYWKQVTPFGRSSEKRKTPHLRDEDKVEVSGMSFRMNNSVYYYDWVDEGHNTAKGWHRRTKHGVVYREAKRRSRVKGQEMTKKTMEFITRNILEYLSKFLDNV